MTEQRPAAELRTTLSERAAWGDLASTRSQLIVQPRWMLDLLHDADLAATLSAANLRLEQRVTDLTCVLGDALEYFENREDVDDGDYGQPKPNREMVLAMALRAAMGLTREGM